MPPKATKANLNNFLFIKDTCNTLITKVHDENTEFTTLADKASSFDKEHLQNALIKLEQKFDSLEAEFSLIANKATQDQIDICADFITEVRNSIASLTKDIKTSVRNFESLSTNPGNGNLQSPTTIIKSNKVNKSFEPKQLKHNANYGTYTQWRNDWFLHLNINQFFKEDISTQRAHLVQLLDTELRATLDSEAPHHDTTAMGPPLSEEQLNSLEQGQAYPAPTFPAPNTCLIGILDIHFNRKEPKMMRLYNYNKACLVGQLQNEGWYEAWTRLDQMYQRNGIESMSKEEYRKMTCITMTRDSALRQKLLQQGEEKSLQDLLAIGQAWQAGTFINSKIEQKQNANDTAVAAKTSSYKTQETHKQKQMWLFKDLMKKKGQCWRCNSTTCKSSSTCRAMGKNCTKCGKLNHFASVCQEDYPQENNKSNQENVYKRLGPPLDSGENKKFKPSGDNKKFKPQI